MTPREFYEREKIELETRLSPDHTSLSTPV
jgi:hypothetical protein